MELHEWTVKDAKLGGRFASLISVGSKERSDWIRLKKP